MQRNRYAVFMAQAGHKVSRFVDFRCVRFQFRFRLAVCVSRLGFVFGISDFGFGFGFVWGFLAALYGIFAIMNGPGLGSHSKCQCYCTLAAGVYFFLSFAPCIYASARYFRVFHLLWFPFGGVRGKRGGGWLLVFVWKPIACGISAIHDDPP